MRNLVKRALAAVLPTPAYFAVNAYVAARDIHSGHRREAEMDLVARYVKAGDTVLDIGANHGMYAYHFARLVGPRGRVHAFEPIPWNLKVLRRTVAGLSNVTIHAEAVGEREGEAEFVVPREGGVPLSGYSHLALSDTEAGLRFRCRIVRPDSRFATEDVAFIKCDIEGAELFAFRGARGLIERCRPTVFAELGSGFLERFHCTQAEVFSLFADLGYDIARVEGTELVPLAPDGNFLFRHARRCSELSH